MTHGFYGNEQASISEIQQLKINGIDPYVIDMERHRPYDQLKNVQQYSFSTNYSRVIYFSERIYNCNSMCVENCKSAVKPFTIYENDDLFSMDPKLELNEPNADRKVYKGQWHGQPAAFKCIFHDVDTDNSFKGIDVEFFEQLKTSNRPGAHNILRQVFKLKISAHSLINWYAPKLNAS